MKRPRRTPKSTRARVTDRGVALLAVLIVVAVLAAVVAEFATTSRLDYRLAHHYTSNVQTRYLARSAVEASAAAIRQTGMDFRESRYRLVTCGGELSQLVGVEETSPLIPTVDAPETEEAPVEPEPSVDAWCVTIPHFPTPGGGDISVRITDERGKINLNAIAPQPAGEPPECRPGIIDDVVAWQFFHLLRMSTRGMEIPEEQLADIVSATIDWVDCDDDMDATDGLGAGAEETYYRSLDTPYDIKNGPMDTPGELLLVRGVTPEIYQSIEPYITTFPYTPGAVAGTVTYENKIALTTAPRSVIIAGILGADYDDAIGWTEDEARAVADCIVSKRHPMEGDSNTNMPAFGKGIIQRCSPEASVKLPTPPKLMVFPGGDRANPRFFRVDAFGSLGGVTTHTRVVLYKRNRNKGSGTRAEFWREL